MKNLLIAIGFIFTSVFVISAQTLICPKLEVVGCAKDSSRSGEVERMVRVIEGGLFSLKGVLDFHMSRGKPIRIIKQYLVTRVSYLV